MEIFFKNSFSSSELILILKYLIFEILLKFDHREKNIFFKRWFQFGCKNVSRKFFGYYYHISNEYVRQLELKIIKKIRILLKFFL
jgi:DNA-directed RNA polymerase sigma subunit (sigma70/sigma32)